MPRRTSRWPAPGTVTWVSGSVGTGAPHSSAAVWWLTRAAPQHLLARPRRPAVGPGERAARVEVRLLGWLHHAADPASPEPNRHPSGTDLWTTPRAAACRGSRP